MRTTIAIDDGLLATAKHRARQKHCTLGQLVEASLEAYLNAEPTEVVATPLPTHRGRIRPGIDLSPEGIKALQEADDLDYVAAYFS